MCRSHSTVREILGSIMETTQWAAVVDMEAGLEHLKRGTVRHVDTMLVVVEPYYKSLELGLRSKGLAEELGIKHLVFVANKVRNAMDQDTIGDYCHRQGISIGATIPHDEAVLMADREGKAPLDTTPGSPALVAIAALAEKIGATAGP